MNRSARSALATEFALFAALGAFGLWQWSRLVAEPPLGRLVAALAIICAAALVVQLLVRSPIQRGVERVVSASLLVVATGAAMVVVGLEASLLAPGNWAELIDEISRGLAGIEDTTLPYADGDDAIRLTLLLGVPALLGLAAALAFLSRRRRPLSRALALVPLVVLYGFPATLDAPEAELLLGAILLFTLRDLALASWSRSAPRGARAGGDRRCRRSGRSGLGRDRRRARRLGLRELGLVRARQRGRVRLESLLRPARMAA